MACISVPAAWTCRPRCGRCVVWLITWPSKPASGSSMRPSGYTRRPRGSCRAAPSTPSRAQTPNTPSKKAIEETRDNLLPEGNVFYYAADEEFNPSWMPTLTRRCGGARRVGR